MIIRHNFYVLAALFCLLCGLSQTKETEKTQQRELFNPFYNVIGKSELQISLEDKFTVDQYAGKFELFSVIPEKKRLIFSEINSGITFNVIEGYDNPNDEWFREKLDSPALQAHPENAGALFQVASNFDCLEGGGGDNSTIMDYLSPGMYVQGEASAISALPGTIQRKYFLSKVNLLEDFNKKWNLGYASGYVQNIPKIKEWFGSMTDSAILDAAQLVKVGVQYNTAITGGYGPTKKELQSTYKNGMYLAQKIDPKNAQRVTQVFTAALNPYYNNSQSLGFKNLARIFLQGAYKGTLQVAEKKDIQKVYLTLIGGGVFQNKMEWIAEAIELAVNEQLYNNPTKKLEINLIIYYSNGYKDRVDYQNAQEILLALVKKTHGTWTRYQTSGTSYL